MCSMFVYIMSEQCLAHVFFSSAAPHSGRGRALRIIRSDQNVHKHKTKEVFGSLSTPQASSKREIITTRSSCGLFFSSKRALYLQRPKLYCDSISVWKTKDTKKRKEAMRGEKSLLNHRGERRTENVAQCKRFARLSRAFGLDFPAITENF
jgi:hypothetical protein